jgi:hypothetical protein
VKSIGNTTPLIKKKPLLVGFKEVLQNESVRRLFYIYTVGVVHAFPATSGASGVKIWHPPRTDREKGSEQERGRGKEGRGVSLFFSFPDFFVLKIIKKKKDKKNHGCSRENWRKR